MNCFREKRPSRVCSYRRIRSNHTTEHRALHTDGVFQRTLGSTRRSRVTVACWSTGDIRPRALRVSESTADGWYEVRRPRRALLDDACENSRPPIAAADTRISSGDGVGRIRAGRLGFVTTVKPSSPSAWKCGTSSRSARPRRLFRRALIKRVRSVSAERNRFGFRFGSSTDRQRLFCSTTVFDGFRYTWGGPCKKPVGIINRVFPPKTAAAATAAAAPPRGRPAGAHDVHARTRDARPICHTRARTRPAAAFRHLTSTNRRRTR